MDRIHEYVKHFLSIHDEETSLRNTKVIYDPYFKTVEVISAGGRCSMDVRHVPGMILLLERVLELERGVAVGNQSDEADAG